MANSNIDLGKRVTNLEKNGGGGGGGSSLITYKEGKERIGTWTDGSPVYRYTFNNVTKSGETLLLENEKIKTILSFNATLDRGTGENDYAVYGSYIFPVLAKKPFRQTEGIIVLGSVSGTLTGYVEFIESEE